MLISVLHSNVGQTNFIGHNFVGIYETTPIGNLDKIRFVEDMTFPLQQAFQCDILARISVTIDYCSAFLASEQCVVSTIMSLPNSTAVGTELGSMPRINYVQRNMFVKTAGSENLPELTERHSHDNLVESSTFGFEFLEVFNGNIRIPAVSVG